MRGGRGHALSTLAGPRLVSLSCFLEPGGRGRGAMARILVTEKIADGGLQQLRDDGHVVDVRLGLTPGELVEVVPDRGAPDPPLRHPGHRRGAEAGIGPGGRRPGRHRPRQRRRDGGHRAGRDGGQRPQSNILSAAEHTMALLLAQARNIPQAHAALVEGRWERSRWGGVELSDKTLGVVGLGRIGKLVAQRAHAFGMRLVAHDPFVSEDRARQLGVELMTLDRLVEVSDFVTLHVAKTRETVGLIDKDLLARAKPGIRIINVARGGIVDEAALAEAVRVGHVGGAALDVFTPSPPPTRPVRAAPGRGRPHLGASTQRRRTRRATPSPSRWAWPWPASSSPSR